MNPDHLLLGFLVLALMAISFMAGGLAGVWLRNNVLLQRSAVDVAAVSVGITAAVINGLERAGIVSKVTPK